MSESKLDVLDVFQKSWFSYYNTDQKTISISPLLGVSEMRAKEMIIETRPRYPSDKVSFTITNMTKDKPIRFFNILLNLNAEFDVDVILEDSQRNLLSSLI